MSKLRYAALTCAMLLLSPCAHAWWETQIMALKDPPRITEVEAETVAVGADVIADAPPFGPEAGGYRAVELPPGKGSLVWKVKVKRSTYVLFAIARVADANPAANPTPEWLILARMRVTGPDGKPIGDWSMPINYLNTYYDTARMYFPANFDGEYTIEFSTGAESKANLLVDRLELRDVLGNTFKKGFKKGRYLLTDEEVAGMRRKYNVPPGREPQLGASDWAVAKAWFTGRASSLYRTWNTFTVGSQTGLSEFYGDRASQDVTMYLQTGNPKIALAATRQLIEAAIMYTATDATVQSGTVAWDDDVSGTMSRLVRFGFVDKRFGKTYSRGYTDAASGLVSAYDALFPFIEANAQNLVEMAQPCLPWIRTRDDLIAFLDTNILQQTADCLDRRVLRGMGGASERLMLKCAVAQGPNPAGDRIMRLLFSNTYMDSANDGGLQDHLISSYLRDGNDILGSPFSAVYATQLTHAASTLTARYVACGGSGRFDLSSPTASPFTLSAYTLPLDLCVAGGFIPNIGRSPSAGAGRERNPWLLQSTAANAEFAFEGTRDPRIASLLKHHVQSLDWTEAFRAEVEKAAQGQRDPILSSSSRNLNGFGMTALESGVESDDFARKRAIVLRHGIGKGNAHNDSLNIEYFDHGVRLIPDAGAWGGYPDPQLISAHLGVCVDGLGASDRFPGTTGNGWTDIFKPRPESAAHCAGVQYVSGGARFPFLPSSVGYRREVALVDIAGLNESYVFDVMRVAGGGANLWNMHGPSLDDAGAYNLELQPAATAEALAALQGHVDPREGVAGDTVECTWSLSREDEKRMLQESWREGQPAIFARSTLFGHAGDKVYIGQTDPIAKGREDGSWGRKIDLVHVERSGRPPMQTVWPQLIEGYRGSPLIKSVKQLDVAPTDKTASAPVALSIETVNGQRDTILADGDGRREVSSGNVKMSGRFGYVSYDDKGLRLANLIAGTRLDDGKLRIEAQTGEYTAKIVSCDYDKREITLDRPLPAKILDGQEFLTNSPDHPQSWRIVKAEGAKFTHDKSAILYQSQIVIVDPNNQFVTCSINPPFLKADPLYYDGVTACNGTGRNWHVISVKPIYLWMYLHEPVQDWREIYTIADFPDADGDGRRTVRITNWGEGNAMRPEIRVEVALVDEVQQVIYFRLPDDEEIVNASGWAWAGSRLNTLESNRWLINEEGRRWQSNYIGKTNAIRLDGPVDDKMFTDADGDGRRVLRMYHFGPGDTVTIPTHVCVARQAGGGFRLDASTPATVTLPDGSRLTSPTE